MGRKSAKRVMCSVDQELREKRLDDLAQHFVTHGGAKIGIGANKTCTPHNELNYGTRIIAVRKYIGGPYTAIVNLAYYFSMVPIAVI